jgi:hypothetical protein
LILFDHVTQKENGRKTILSKYFAISEREYHFASILVDFVFRIVGAFQEARILNTSTTACWRQPGVTAKPSSDAQQQSTIGQVSVSMPARALPNTDRASPTRNRPSRAFPKAPAQAKPSHSLAGISITSTPTAAV